MARYYGVSVGKNSAEVQRKVHRFVGKLTLKLVQYRQCFICICNAARGQKCKKQVMWQVLLFARVLFPPAYY